MAKSNLFSSFLEYNASKEEQNINVDIKQPSEYSYIPPTIQDLVVDNADNKITQIKLDLQSYKLTNYTTIRKLYTKIKKYKTEDYSDAKAKENINSISQQQMLDNYVTLNLEQIINNRIKQDTTFKYIVSGLEELIYKVKDKREYIVNNGIVEEDGKIVNDDTLIKEFSFINKDMNYIELTKLFELLRYNACSSCSVIKMFITGIIDNVASSILSIPTKNITDYSNDIISKAKLLYNIKDAKIRYSLENFMGNNHFVMVKSYANNRLYPLVVSLDTDISKRFKLYFLRSVELEKLVTNILVPIKCSIQEQLLLVNKLMEITPEGDNSKIEHVNLCHQMLTLIYINIYTLYILIKYSNYNLASLSN